MESSHIPKKVPRRHYSASPTRLPRAFNEDEDEDEDDEDVDEDDMTLPDWVRSRSPLKPQSLSVGRVSFPLYECGKKVVVSFIDESSS